jgi:hypothetical protein
VIGVGGPDEVLQEVVVLVDDLGIEEVLHAFDV